MTDNANLTVTCPCCKQPAAWHNNAFKPFCSERCKNKDFIGWANEDYKLASKDESPFSDSLPLVEK